jgi:hypothetical protein
LRKKKKDPDHCPMHEWGKPHPFRTFWLKSYWTAECKRCGATMGRMNEDELREAMRQHPRGEQAGE